MKEKLIPVNVIPGLKGIVYAKTKDNHYHDDWLILVYGVKNTTCDFVVETHIDRYISYNITKHYFCFDKNGAPSGWGKTTGYNFYYPTDEQKKIIINELSRRGYKYVKALNRLFER